MKAKCPVCGSRPPPTHTKWMEMEGGVQLKRLNSLLREHQLWRGTAIPPTSKKMEPRSYFNIKNALNGFTYNLVPKDHYEMQSLCIISVSVINIGARVGLQFFRMSPIKMIFFLLHFVNSLTPPHTPWPPKSQIYRKKKTELRRNGGKVEILLDTTQRSLIVS